MEIANSLDRLSSKLDHLDNTDLLHLLTSLENMITKTRDFLMQKSSNPPPLTPPPPPSTPKPTTQFGDLFRYSPLALPDNLVTKVHEHLKGLKYHPNPTSPNSPEIFLYGDQPYKYNKQSSEVSPTPIISSLPMAELLLAVNGSLHTKYNSMLINKYRNLHCSLGPHQDDETSLDPSSPISALSLGARRRMQISLNEDKNTAVHTVNLESKSLCTMMPGFQDMYYHAILPGRKSMPKEKGVRYSVTFRHILSEPATSQSMGTMNMSTKEENGDTEIDDIKEDENEEPKATDDSAFPDTLVFGSSLTKDLDSTKLSKYNKKFMVFPHSGAKVNDIKNDIKLEAEFNRSIDSSKVTSVFLVCGGNDIENLHKDADIEDVYMDYESLVGVTREVFPAAVINIVSLIPRRTRYKCHIENMHEMNEWLNDFCNNSHSCRFVNVFTHFLVKLPHIWLLNEKLFNNRHLHFNGVGNSVLAKVLIGVANRPR